MDEEKKKSSILWCEHWNVSKISSANDEKFPIPTHTQEYFYCLLTCLMLTLEYNNPPSHLPTLHLIFLLTQNVLNINILQSTRNSFISAQVFKRSLGYGVDFGKCVLQNCRRDRIRNRDSSLWIQIRFQNRGMNLRIRCVEILNPQSSHRILRNQSAPICLVRPRGSDILVVRDAL